MHIKFNIPWNLGNCRLVLGIGHGLPKPHRMVSPVCWPCQDTHAATKSIGDMLPFSNLQGSIPGRQQTSLRFKLAMDSTLMSKTADWKKSSLVMHNLFLQQMFSASRGIRLHYLQIHHGRLLLLPPPPSPSGSFSLRMAFSKSTPPWLLNVFLSASLHSPSFNASRNSYVIKHSNTSIKL